METSLPFVFQIVCLLLLHHWFENRFLKRCLSLVSLGLSFALKQELLGRVHMFLLLLPTPCLSLLYIETLFFILNVMNKMHFFFKNKTIPDGLCVV